MNKIKNNNIMQLCGFGLKYRNVVSVSSFLQSEKWDIYLNRLPNVDTKLDI